MKNKVIIKRIAVCAIPFIVVGLLYLGMRFITDNTKSSCIYYATVHLYCPGCGLTRAAEALFNGDILLSLRQNLLLLTGLIIAALYYIELLLNTFGIKLRIKLLHSYKMLWGALIFVAVFTAARNIFPVLAPFY